MFFISHWVHSPLPSVRLGKLYILYLLNAEKKDIEKGKDGAVVAEKEGGKQMRRQPTEFGPLPIQY